MTDAQLRARIRELLQSGELPRALPAAQQITPGHPTRRIAQIQVGRVAEAPCFVCGEPSPMVTYSYPAGRVVRLHAACDALWQQERTRS